MKIAHLYYSVNGNWGDEIVGLSMRELCKEFISKDIVFETIDICRFHLDIPREVERINGCDCLLIGGGGSVQFFPYLDHYTNQLQDIKVPLIVYGVGNNLIGGDQTQAKAIFDRFLAKSPFCRVRRDGSAEIMLAQSNIAVAKCPPVVSFISRYVSGERPIPQSYVLFAMAGDVAKGRFDRNGVRQHDFTQRFKEVVQYTQNLGFATQFIHHRYEDRFCKIPSEVDLDSIYGNDNKPLRDHRFFTDPSYGLSFYQHASLVIGMRGHSQIIPFSYCTPCISLQNQDKNVGFMREIGLSSYNLAINDKDFVGKAKALIDDAISHQTEIKSQMQTVYGDWLAAMQQDFEEIKGILS